VISLVVDVRKGAECTTVSGLWHHGGLAAFDLILSCRILSRVFAVLPHWSHCGLVVVLQSHSRQHSCFKLALKCAPAFYPIRSISRVKELAQLLMCLMPLHPSAFGSKLSIAVAEGDTPLLVISARVSNVSDTVS
jgi:hypothetical protein